MFGSVASLKKTNSFLGLIDFVFELSWGKKV